MTPTEKKEAVRQAILQANPLKQKDITEVYEVGGWDEEYIIRLADVLVAIGQHFGVSRSLEIHTEGNGFYFRESSIGEYVRFEMSQDFDHQSEAVWEFLYGLLCE